MLEVREINEITNLGEYRSAWQRLLHTTDSASFFQSLEWLECYWRHFGAGQKLRVLTVLDGGEPKGILPLVVRREKTRVGTVRVLTYPLHDWGTFFGPIGPDPAATLAAGLEHIRRTRRDWDILDLRWVDAEAADHGCTERAMTEAGFVPLGQKWDRTSLVELPASWDAYWLSREPKFRKNIDQLQRRMSEQGEVELVRFRAAASDGSPNGPAVDPRWDLYDACVELARRSWQGRSGDETHLCHAVYGEFFRDAHAAAAAHGAADVNLLYFDGQPAAFAYNYAWKGAVYGLRKGFDPRLARLRPGLVLQKMMLEDGLRRGDHLYDLGTGSQRTKTAWRTAARTSYRYTHFSAAAFRAQLLWLNRWLRRRLRGVNDVACASLESAVKPSS